MLPGAWGRNEEHMKASVQVHSTGTWSGGMSTACVDGVYGRGDRICTQLPVVKIFFIDIERVVERRTFQKEGRKYLFICKW